MLRRNFMGIAAMALASAVGLSAAAAQVKDAPRKSVPIINAPKIVDINSAPAADIIAVGIDGTLAKKIVDGRPYRNKRDLLTRQLLTKEQYEKFKDMLIAKRPAK